MELLKEALDTVLFGDDEDSLLRASLSEGHPDSRVAVIVGDNASGKSFLVTLISAFCNLNKEHKAEPLQVSMKYRTMEGMHRAFMYGVFGDEADSTGSISMSGVTGLLNTARKREKPHWALLDEPDLGMSESYSRAMGKWLAQEFATLGPLTVGMVLVSHSKALVSSLFENSPHRPWFVHMGPKLAMEDWLQDRSEKTVEELLSLQDRSHHLHLAIEERLKQSKRSRA
jgi:ABC-type branched-subunit amino acid transport system ATPase component